MNHIKQYLVAILCLTSSCHLYANNIFDDAVAFKVAIHNDIKFVSTNIGLVEINNKKIKFIQDRIISQGINSVIVNSVAVNSTHLFSGTNNDGIVKVDFVNNYTVVNHWLPGLEIMDIKLINDNTLLVATVFNGIYKIDLRTDQAIKITDSNAKSLVKVNGINYILGDERVKKYQNSNIVTVLNEFAYSIISTKDRTLVLTRSGMVELLKDNTVKKIDNRIYTRGIYNPANNQLFLSSLDKTLHQVNPDTLAVINEYTIGDNATIYDLKVDQDNTLWMATNQGIFTDVQSLTPSIKNQNTDLGGEMYITANASLEFHCHTYGVTHQGKVIDAIQKVSGWAFLSSCYVDDQNQLWIGANDALIHYDANTGKAQTYLDQVQIRSVKSGYNGQLLLGTQKHGLLVFDRYLRTRVQQYDDGHKVIATHAENPDTLSYVTDHQLKVVQQGQLIHTINIPGLSPTPSVIKKKNVVFIATNGEGIHRVDLSTGTINTYTPADGLPTPLITALSWHQGRLWAGTFKGLAYLEGDRFLAYGEKRSINYNSMLVGAGNRLIAAGSFGRLAVNADAVAPIPRAIVTYVTSDGEALDHEAVSLAHNHPGYGVEAYLLKHPQSGFNLEYRLISEDFISNWRPYLGQTLTPKQSAGAHRVSFRVQQLPSMQKHITVTIEPPWYLTSSAWSLGVLGLLGLLSLAYKKGAQAYKAPFNLVASYRKKWARESVDSRIEVARAMDHTVKESKFIIGLIENMEQCMACADALTRVQYTKALESLRALARALKSDDESIRLNAMADTTTLIRHNIAAAARICETPEHILKRHKKADQETTQITPELPAKLGDEAKTVLKLAVQEIMSDESKRGLDRVVRPDPNYEPDDEDSLSLKVALGTVKDTVDSLASLAMAEMHSKTIKDLEHQALVDCVVMDIKLLRTVGRKVGIDHASLDQTQPEHLSYRQKVALYLAIRQVLFSAHQDSYIKLSLRQAPHGMTVSFATDTQGQARDISYQLMDHTALAIMAHDFAVKKTTCFLNLYTIQ